MALKKESAMLALLIEKFLPKMPGLLPELSVGRLATLRQPSIEL